MITSELAGLQDDSKSAVMVWCLYRRLKSKYSVFWGMVGFAERRFDFGTIMVDSYNVSHRLSSTGLFWGGGKHLFSTMEILYSLAS